MLADTKPQTGRTLHRLPPNGRGGRHDDSQGDVRIDAQRIEDHLKATNAKKMSEIVERNRDKTLFILRHWLHEGE